MNDGVSFLEDVYYSHLLGFMDIILDVNSSCFPILGVDQGLLGELVCQLLI
jgi:hypothetical protein